MISFHSLCVRHVNQSISWPTWYSLLKVLSLSSITMKMVSQNEENSNENEHENLPLGELTKKVVLPCFTYPQLSQPIPIPMSIPMSMPTITSNHLQLPSTVSGVLLPPPAAAAAAFLSPPRQEEPQKLPPTLTCSPPEPPAPYSMEAEKLVDELFNRTKEEFHSIEPSKFYNSAKY